MIFQPKIKYQWNFCIYSEISEQRRRREYTGHFGSQSDEHNPSEPPRVIDSKLSVGESGRDPWGAFANFS